MSRLFKSRLFGFNKEDVLNYISEMKIKESDNKKTIFALNNEITEANEKISLLNNELAKANEVIEEFNQRESALTALSESIGRLYLVAQANADAVTSAANENAALSERAVAHNFAVADTAEAQLEEIGIILEQKTAQYLTEVAELRAAVTDAKATISNNNSKIAINKAELNKITSGEE